MTSQDRSAARGLFDSGRHWLDTTTETQLVDRGCPTCGAPPGDFCHTPTGKPRSDHVAREYEEVEPDGD